MDHDQRSYAVSISLPDEQVFRNLKNAKHFAIDIGGSLAKLAYSSTLKRRTSHVSEEFSESECPGSIYQVSEEDEYTNRLHFVKFETRLIETCFDFIQRHLKGSPLRDKVIKATGGGAHKYRDLINSKLGVQIDKEDEIQCLIQGCDFLLQNIPDEAFSYHHHEKPEYKFQGVGHNVFPYLLVNIGSGVSLIKVDSETKFERIGGSSNGGGTFWGLGSLLTKAKTFDELLDLAAKGDHRKVDMLVKDIYGGEYSSIGLTGDVIASSFGKATQSNKDQESHFKQEDIARSLLLSISNDIGQIACLHAKLHGLTKIYFGGYFIRGHPFTMRTITFAINFWSKGEMQPLFLRHEGYLGAIGAFLKGAAENGGSGELHSWGENYARSSGLSSTKESSVNWRRVRSSTFDMLELDMVNARDHCPVLLHPDSYIPDTEDLTKDAPARQYWLDCFSNSVDMTKDLAIKSQRNCPDAKERAEKFKARYLERLNELKENPCAYGSLTVRCLLDTSSHLLRDFLFTDPYSQQKQVENEEALRSLPDRLRELDLLSSTDRQLDLVRGMLAGNVFDWGAKEVVKMMESGQKFGFTEAQDKVEERPWLFDNFDAWLERLNQMPPHRCAVVFCDNSGADIILGLFPFVRELLTRGTKVILCANSRPTLNDVTYNELTILVKCVSEICPVIDKALKERRLLPMETGQESPCLDLRLIDQSLVKAIVQEKADLVIIEGMGRAVHTNLNAQFSCESLKVAVLKNKWLANRLGGEIFSVIFKYEKPSSQDTRVVDS